MFKYIKKAKNTGGFSLLEIVLTIIIIGLALSAITESFIAGSAKSVNIVNEETAVNVAKQEMAALNYCRNRGIVTGVCNIFNNTGNPNCTGGNQDTWDCPSSFIIPQGPTPVNNECFYTVVTASNIVLKDNGGSVCTSSNCPPPLPSPSNNIIQTIVKTGWFVSNAGGGSCPTHPAGCPGTTGSCPYITLSTVYANY